MKKFASTNRNNRRNNLSLQEVTQKRRHFLKLPSQGGARGEEKKTNTATSIEPVSDDTYSVTDCRR
jgi:hypothetical protein